MCLFVCEIFNDAVNNLRYVTSNKQMETNHEFERVWNKIVGGVTQSTMHSLKE